jgi:hypothetical protein
MSAFNAEPLTAPMQVRAALAEISDTASLRVWDEFLDRAYAKALETGMLKPIQEFLGSTWTSIETYRDAQHDELPPAWQRVSDIEFVTSWQDAHPEVSIDAAGGAQ